MRSYYEVLEVSADATSDMIKEQYRFLVQAWHPDKFPNPAQKLKAEEKLKEINAAYEVLRNSTKRAEYDMRLHSIHFSHRQEYPEQASQRQSEDERLKREEAARRAREEQLRKDRAKREREEESKRQSEYARQQKENLDPEKLEAEKYGIEVVVCPSCGTTNSLSFTQCRKCSKDITKVRPIRNPYISKENIKNQKTQSETPRQQNQQKQKEEFNSAKRGTTHQHQQQRKVNQESPKIERQRVEKYGIEIIICSNCGTKNSLSFSRCLNCFKDLGKEKSVPNPYVKYRT
jgi:curved DNA-binding protein CbpA